MPETDETQVDESAADDALAPTAEPAADDVPVVDEPVDEPDDDEDGDGGDEPTPAEDDEPDDEPAEDEAPEVGAPGEPECEFDIQVGDIWTCPAGTGETVHVIGFDGGDPIVQSEDTSEQRTVSASTLILWRHDGPTHHEAGAARL